MDETMKIPVDVVAEEYASQMMKKATAEGTPKGRGMCVQNLSFTQAVPVAPSLASFTGRCERPCVADRLHGRVPGARTARAMCCSLCRSEERFVTNTSAAVWFRQWRAARKQVIQQEPFAKNRLVFAAELKLQRSRTKWQQKCPTGRQPDRTQRKKRALGEMVLDSDGLVYFRIFGWWLQLQTWSTLRFADHRGLEPKDLQVAKVTLLQNNRRGP